MGYTFRADSRLRIVSWGDNIAGFTGKSFSAVSGKKYFEVLPRIVAEDRDAVEKVFESKRGIALKGYQLSHCLFGSIGAEVSVAPVNTNGSFKIAEVTFVPDVACSVVQKLQEAQRFIDIGKIASTLAHGVRNPLNAIKGAVVYLRERYPGELTLIEFTKIIEDEILRLDNFISKFLSTAVTETDLTGTDINAVLDRIKVYTSFQASASNILSVYEFGEIPPVFINPFKIEQALLNVINNAMEAMASGGQLSVKTMAEKKGKAVFVVIEISDTGHGMKEAGTCNMNNRRKGRGFGLFLTREILKYYGGFLEMQSRKGAGTAVYLYLPAQKTEFR